MEKELKKIKYHQKILLNIMTYEEPDSALFFHKIIDYDLDEFQVNSLIKLLTIFEEYLNKNTPFSKETIKELKKIGLAINNDFLCEENILSEFEKCITTLGINIKIKYLLLSLKKQYLHENLCNQLLKKIQD